jgi:four helix bundle protein
MTAINDQCQMTKAQRKSKSQKANMALISDSWGGNGSGVGITMHDDEVPYGKKYDLEERTAIFGENVIRFAKKIPFNPVNKRLIEQLVGAATSVGANYCEADDGVSKKDFRNKIGTCRKEAKETKFFLRMIATAEEQLRDEARKLWKEAKELHLIFCAIYRK